MKTTRPRTIDNQQASSVCANTAFKRTMISIAACALFTTALGTFYTPAAAQTPSGANRAGDGVTLNFVNAEIAEVARTMGVLTNRNIVVDPRVKGAMNLSSDKTLSVGAAYNQFLTALRLQGFAVVEAAGISKVVPEADAKLQGGSVTTSESKGSGNQIVTQIFRLNYETANNLVAILRPLISPNNTINVNPGNNSLVITDYADNLQRMARIISALDVSNATDLEVIPLKHALASDLAPLLIRLADAGSAGGAAQGQADTSFKTAILAEPRSNSIILRASNPARVNLIKSLIDKLDQPTARSGANGDAGNIYVVYLKNADAVKLATTLRAAIAGTNTGAGGSGGAAAPAPATASAPGASAAAAPLQAAAGPSTGGQIQADPALNALIITAAEPQYRQMRAVIDKLDQRRAQVFIESLIVEVNADNSAEFGVQWQGLIGNKGDGVVAGLGTNFTQGTTNIIGLSTSATPVPSGGLNIGILPRINGRYTLGFVANFLQKNADGNVLSAPNLLTIDNEEAKIVIGQNVPFVTGQFTNTGAGSGGASVNPFQTIERKDVGITLRVKPQISENGSIRLQIFQESSSVDPGSKKDPSGLTTNKRSIESTVLVDDGSIVVVGGLMQDEYGGGKEKVPLLGDIPFFGNLFKSETRNRKKSNLMLFLRPVVVRDSVQTEALTLDRYDLMRTDQKDQQPKSSSALGINDAPVLPPLTPSKSLLKGATVPKPLIAPPSDIVR